MSTPEANLAARLKEYCADTQISWRYAEAMCEAADAIERLTAERDSLKETLHDELAENLRLRDLGGALPDEGMTAYIERLIAERDALRADAEIGRQWREDSSLEKWFPLAAERLAALEAETAALKREAHTWWTAARAALAAAPAPLMVAAFRTSLAYDVGFKDGQKATTPAPCVDPFCACRGGPCAECSEGQALTAAPAPESVLAYMAVNREGEARFTDNAKAAEELERYGWAITPLSQAPAPLTDEQLRDALRQCPHDTVEALRVRWLYAKDFARAIERAHGIGTDARAQAQGGKP
jgi:hypothetical protein